MRLRDKMRSTLEQHRLERQGQSLSLRRALRFNRAEIAAQASAVRYRRRQMLEQAPVQINRNSPSAIQARSSTTRPAFARTTVDDPLQDILRAIQFHREGVSIAELGNEVGRDWRTLIDPLRTLAETGAIEQIEELFYAIGE